MKYVVVLEHQPDCLEQHGAVSEVLDFHSLSRACLAPCQSIALVICRKRYTYRVEQWEAKFKRLFYNMPPVLIIVLIHGVIP